MCARQEPEKGRIGLVATCATRTYLLAHGIGQTKGYVPLSDRVRELLRVRQATTKSPWVFPSNRKKKTHISYFSVAKHFSTVRKEAKIPKGVVLYSARHSLATDMLDRTGTIVLVGKMLGHRSVTTTQRYLHPAMKGLAELVNERNAMRAQQGNC